MRRRQATNPRRYGCDDAGRHGGLGLEPLEPRWLLAALAPGVLVSAGGAPIGGDYDTTPAVADFDADGKKDLLVGQFSYGYINFYKNTGTNAAPVLNAGVQLTTGSPPTPIATSYG
jgi:hypothetical protein